MARCATNYNEASYTPLKHLPSEPKAVEEPNEPLLRFAAEKEVTIHHLGIVEDGNPWDPLTELCVVDALRHIIDSRNHPLLICCGMGRHRTGTVVGCLRILQGWNLASALEEYRRYTGPRRSRVVNELQIESFRKESVPLPPESVMAPWLWVAQMHLQELRREEAKRAEAVNVDLAPSAAAEGMEDQKRPEDEKKSHGLTNHP
ncbi:MAG: tyrosine-protein phosphatase required for protection against superoxide stress (By similarity) [Trizodia sp. TS-e1964]|nr:MAG: tyrosine-protein phosphatase required for protection against superoxide stress (By similarity) [Trizodia sp. TS-e1964]